MTVLGYNEREREVAHRPDTEELASEFLTMSMERLVRRRGGRSESWTRCAEAAIDEVAAGLLVASALPRSDYGL